VISFALEGHIFGLKPDDYWEIISNDQDGPNEDPQKARAIRVFKIPDHFTVPDSSPNKDRTLKIFAAFISESWVWVLTDFSGLVRMHVHSKSTPWMQEDLNVGSKVSRLLSKILICLRLTKLGSRHGMSYSVPSREGQIGSLSGLWQNPGLTAGGEQFCMSGGGGRLM